MAIHGNIFFAWLHFDIMHFMEMIGMDGKKLLHFMKMIHRMFQFSLLIFKIGILKEESINMYTLICISDL